MVACKQRPPLPHEVKHEEYPVLAAVSRCYPDHQGRLPTRYSPVRRSTQDRSPFLARLACVKHASSVQSEPGSNSPVKNCEGSTCIARFLLYKSIRPTRYLIVKDLGRSRRAEEEALTSFHPCQRLSAFFLKELSALSKGRVPLSVAARCASTEAPHSRQLLSASSSGKDLAGRLGHSAFPCGEGRFYVNRVPLSTTFFIHLEKIAPLNLCLPAVSCGEGRFYVNRIPSSTLFSKLFKKHSPSVPRLPAVHSGEGRF